MLSDFLSRSGFFGLGTTWSVVAGNGVPHPQKVMKPSKINYSAIFKNSVPIQTIGWKTFGILLGRLQDEEQYRIVVN